MKFAHIADPHLGFHQYLLRQRRDDYTNSFLWCIKDAIDEEKVDFIIIAGDVFNSKKPSYHTMSDFRYVIDWLSEYKIPLFAITGNHCHTTGMTWVDYFGYSNYRRVNGVNVSLVNWHSNPMSVVKDLPKCNNEFNILLLHHGTVDHYGVIEDKDINIIKDKGFDYVALGHIHLPYVKNNLLFNPGSPEYTSSDNWGNPGGYYVVEINNDRTFIPRHKVSPHRASNKYQLALANVKSAKDLVNVINKHIVFEAGSLNEVTIYGEINNTIVNEAELLLQGNVLRTKLKLVDKELVLDSVKKDVDVYKQVYGDDAMIAKKIIESASDTKGVIQML